MFSLSPDKFLDVGILQNIGSHDRITKGEDEDNLSSRNYLLDEIPNSSQALKRAWPKKT